MVQLSDYYDARDQLVSFMETDLLGPSAPDEVIADPPATRYVCGALFPKASGSVSPEGDDSRGSADRDYDETGAPDPAVAMSNVRYPSSCGMTFAVDTNVTEMVEIEVQCGRYDEVEAEEAADEQQSTKSGTAWKRSPIEAGPFSIDLRAPDPGRRTAIGDTGLTLFWRVRSADEQGAVSVTVVLLNERTAPASGLRDAYCFFQPRLTVFAPDAPGVPFVNRPWRGTVGVDKDADTYRLLYRSCPNYGVGHGCSVDWETTGRGLELRTTFAPRHELLISESNPRIPSIPMRLLAEGRRETTVQLLRGLVDGYSSWTREQREALSELDESLRPIAESHLADCEEAAARIAEGVDVLERDDSALKAFALANKAMADQRSRLVRIDEGRPGQDLESVECEWRPFQVAFLLLCLPGIVDHSSPQRELVDLLWFPTGGGKTEAYLGLIAFTVFFRRLRSGEAGVTALMRYTLRLLTAQQFERAAALILACEAIRKTRDDLGTKPISIGLWVGRGGTPNTLTDAARALNNLKANRPAGDKGNPIQLHRCPRCGTRLGPNNYWIGDTPRNLVVSCRHSGCEFERRLPVHVVDEDIYAVRPTLLVGTVDKFASLPWNERTGSIFNVCQGQPPELIIQDELHLISGPLGTLTGLYETAVDLLCQSPDGSMPKVVASTATIRRADDQSLGLFARDLRQFPPPGLTIDDSYFAKTAPKESRGSRLYVGLMAPGSSHATLMIRAYAALLQSAADGEMPEEARDAYWTLVGYFNSLRVLGGARMQVQDDVQDRMALLARTRGTGKRDVEMIVEMTSRESSATIPDRLRQMKVAYPNREAIDVLLATNMISVGVDIDRFSLMAIMGQPQSAAEYIQASSRVGRKHPGLVVTLFNSARSRDRSHYESFRTFHNAMYRQVEATSVTPFSPRARDRGLGPVFVALARLTIPGLRANDSAALVGDFIDDLHALRDRIVSRAVRVEEREAEATREQLDAILSDWVTRASTQSQLSYSNPHHPDRALLVDASVDVEQDGSIPALWSLRDVDQTSNLYLVRAR